ncbi:Reverse transcriptase domain-containing protein, partial [Aphis craccivora]
MFIYKSDSGKPLLYWFKSYLSTRTQWVIIAYYPLGITNIMSNFPQGGHLFSIVFVLFINVLNNSLKYCTISDIFKLFLQINSEDDYLCKFCFQNDFNNLRICDNHGISLNVSYFPHPLLTKVSIKNIRRYTLHAMRTDVSMRWH